MFFRIIFIVCCLCTRVLAQSEGWQEISIGEGLSQGMIQEMTQTKDGFIWVATKDGLNRYDGYNFKVFTHDPYNKYSIAENNCTQLLEDSKGRLWVSINRNRLDLFDARTQRFYHCELNLQTKLPASSYEISALLEDPEGNIWVGAGQNSVFKISLPTHLKNGFPSEANFTKDLIIKEFFLDAVKNQENIIRYISFSTNHQAVIVTNYGLYQIDWKNPRTTTRIPVAFNQKSPWATEDKQGRLLIAQSSRSILFWKDSILKNVPTSVPVDQSLIIKNAPQSLFIRKIADGQFLITSDKYLWLMSSDEILRRGVLTPSSAFSALPPEIGARAMLKDSAGNIWLGTGGYGLRKLNPQFRHFHSYLPKTSVYQIYQDHQGRTYICSPFDLFLVERTTNKAVSLKLNSGRYRLHHLVQDRQGVFWLTVTDELLKQELLWKFSTDWKLLKTYLLPSNVLLGYRYNKTLEDKEGNLWLADTRNQLVKFIPQTEAFRVYSYQHLFPKNSTDEILDLYQDHAGRLWIGTQKGLVKVENPQANTPSFRLYRNSRTDRKSLSNDVVSSMIDDPYQPSRYLWVSTKGGGLERFDKQTDDFEHFTEEKGLPNKVVYGLLEDESKHLWMSTNRGIARLNVQTLTFRNFTKADGLQDDEFNTQSYFKAASGELLFGGVNGLTIFRASEVAESKMKPIVKIIGLKINNKTIEPGDESSILLQSIDYLPPLHLAHDQNLVTLEFALNDFTNSARNRYRYQLVGVDKNWVEAGTNRFANYAQLPAGNYTFRVQGSANGEEWSRPIALRIQINPPFYRTWWAYLLYFSLLAYVVYRLYLNQLRQAILRSQVAAGKREAERLEELDALKTRFFTNISHEFRTPLTLLIGPLADLKAQMPHISVFNTMLRNGNRLLHLINQLLDLSKLEAGQLQPDIRQQDLIMFLKILGESYQSLAKSQKIQFEIIRNIDSAIAYFDEDKVEKIVSNLLSNAFKFTPQGQSVTLSIHYEEATARCILRVIDTGIGIAESRQKHIFDRFYQIDSSVQRQYEGTGIGLALVKEVVQVLKGNIYLQSRERQGSTFTVELPVGRDDWKHLPMGEKAIEEYSAVVSTKVNNAKENEVTDSVIPASDNLLLIVDDNADIRAYVRSLFAASYAIIEAENGLAGLERAIEQVPDLIISDLMMPQMDGFTFCQQLKANTATSHIPVLMLTANASLESRLKGYELGADDYLTKPFNKQEIQARVKNLIQAREHLRQKYSQITALNPASEESESASLTLDEQFLKRAHELIDAHLSDSSFGVEAFCEGMHLSRSQVWRKLKALTNQTVTEFIRKHRLQAAGILLQRQSGTVSEVAYQVGFESLSYFSKAFQEEYGVFPSDYTKNSPVQQ
ncbi:hybrid sensor histidine kinase/response regulator transcription factor [Runella limosa]|uniref:hybrid sensor histidine kinase/response regulator transcription factor n=1 Tax=Runella limosa TaxID=370978 RepID=UPI00055BB4F8|nr:two-component regulator propeller domain-containing protein [Runella limosa]